MHEELSRARIDEERVKQKLEVVAQENEKLKEENQKKSLALDVAIK